MNTIAILYICTGKYSCFWDGFYKSMEKKFLVNSEKHYYIFTDNDEILATKNDKIHTVYQELEEWPYPTLNRFKYFQRIKDELLKYDYVFFLNSNLIVKKAITEEEFLPQGNERLVVALNPGFYNKTPGEFPYDRNKDCSAYIPEGNGKHYFAGGLNGGYAKDFIELIDELAYNTESDLSRNIIALWHDESQINHYMWKYDKEYKILDPSYLYPEGWKLPFEQKMMLIDKNKRGGHSFLRNQNSDKQSIFSRILKRIRVIE